MRFTSSQYKAIARELTGQSEIYLDEAINIVHDNLMTSFPPMDGTYTDGEYVYEVSNSWVIGMRKDGVMKSFDGFGASRFWQRVPA